ncbi:tetratricopeptide repeat protein [Synechococcus elongatus]|uniref:TPR repeat n=3 Tax=Synechococcus TaxID=1129 RepID=Q31MQ8_SYNE7|nr:tetratricopeptide repeat protein [Synechococcus elongatus]ABB57661.1 TPR repeat [Synechococcus elongatus PCC 7942 = FACHB-805]AJD58001.1 CytB protein [Synechococcus elongatus UTEX 2973]MBD2588469.1 tetratricopeptide repeat protein [Synechococcus elongatus FACHB-242]MBD2689368.1 tetratricopeptide repeat protein [Synechococcus elongatus FACHB-1061]MBD2708213.1 tetratricopeptide repeat protein [Synechococcus elongatus PCC 7942 = FACHB-805]
MAVWLKLSLIVLCGCLSCWVGSVWAQPPLPGFAALSAGQYPLADRQLSQAIAHGKATAALYGNRCWVRLSLERYEEAIKDCSVALDLQPHEPETWLNRGLAYYRQGQSQAAIADFDQLLQQSPTDYRAYYNRGLAYLDLAQPEQAIADFQQALERLPATEIGAAVDLHTDRCMGELHRAQPGPAVSACSQALELQPSAARARYLRALAYWQLHQPQAAIADLRQACDAFAQAGATVQLDRARQLLQHWQQQSSLVAQAPRLQSKNWPGAVTYAMDLANCHDRSPLNELEFCCDRAFQQC